MGSLRPTRGRVAGRGTEMSKAKLGEVTFVQGVVTGKGRFALGGDLGRELDFQVRADVVEAQWRLEWWEFVNPAWSEASEVEVAEFMGAVRDVVYEIQASWDQLIEAWEIPMEVSS